MSQHSKQGDSLPLADGLCTSVLSTSQTCIIKIQFKNKNKLFIKASCCFFFCHTFSRYILQSAVLLLWSDTPENHSQLFQCEFPPGHAERGEWIDIYWHFLICLSPWETVEQSWVRGAERAGCSKTRTNAGALLLNWKTSARWCAVCSSVYFLLRLVSICDFCKEKQGWNIEIDGRARLPLQMVVLLCRIFSFTQWHAVHQYLILYMCFYASPPSCPNANRDHTKLSGLEI